MWSVTVELAGRLQLTGDEARGLMLFAQGLFDGSRRTPSLDDLRGMIERLGVVQIDTISVVERTQYLVLWSRLGGYDARHLDALLYPHRHVFEYWGHAASILPMADYPYYRRRMLHYAEHMWSGDRSWLTSNAHTVAATLELLRARGPLASADFERPPDARRTGPWDWHGPKDSRRALEVLWTMGDIMVHSRRAGQKLYDTRERVLDGVLAGQVCDDDVPSREDCARHFARRTIRALGVVTPAWLWDYFRVGTTGMAANGKVLAASVLEDMVRAGEALPAAIDGLAGAAYLDPARLTDLDQLRQGRTPRRTTLLSPFDSLIWDRGRALALFNYEVCFEAYVPPPKRRYGYYCLAILHRGKLVGRVDPKMDRSERRLTARSVYLEPGVRPTKALADGLAGALLDLGRFLGAQEVALGRCDSEALSALLAERLTGVAV